MDTKKIFVLGNGFDLAHYLPTAYVHFMDAMRVVEGSEENAELGFDDLFHKYISGDCSERDKEFFQKTKKLYKTDDLQLSPDTVKGLRGSLKSNGWFQHFKYHLTDVDTWIDFENEIQSLLIKMCNVFDMSFNDKTIGYFSERIQIYLPNMNGGRNLMIKPTDVLSNDCRQVNKDFFDNFKLQKMFVQNTLRNFLIIEDIYYKAEEIHNQNGFGASSIQYSKIAAKERDGEKTQRVRHG